MTLPHGSSLETRPSLLKKLQSGDDPQSWQEFYQIYGGLIRFFALKAGLTADEAEEVVQETAIGVARRLPEFVYDPKVCRFKSWLLNLTRWRIQNQFKKRRAPGGLAGASLSLFRKIHQFTGMLGVQFLHGGHIDRSIRILDGVMARRLHYCNITEPASKRKPFRGLGSGARVSVQSVT